MAAEVALSVVLERIATLIEEKLRSSREVANQMQLIGREADQMRSFLRDAEEKQITSANVKTWLASIQETAYDAGDLIDTYILYKERKLRRSLFKRYALTLILHDWFALRKITKEIERIQTNIRKISENRSTYGIENIGGERGVELISSAESLREQRRTSPHSSQTIPIVGLSKDVVLLAERLVQGNLSPRVVSIVGIGGSGKTTLARTIYNSDIVRRHFDRFVWIYVSQIFEPKEILREIRNQLSEEMASTSTSEENALQKSLFDHKYLIVLDDVWTTDVWTRVQETIPNRENGSKILLTTRKRDVAIDADEEPHELQLLNDQDAWMLFKHLAFKGRQDFPPELIELGRSIVGKCEGLPLAIVLIGSLLCRKDASTDAWSRVFDSLSWHLKQDPRKYSSILALSYYDLPDYLKPCFLYFGIFTEGFQIPVQKLIRLWIEEEFVRPRDREELEDIGMDYIEEFVDRNIIQVTHRKENGKKFIQSAEMDQKTKMAIMRMNGKSQGRSLTCSMHGFVRDLSVSMAKEENFLDVYANEIHDTSYNLGEKRVQRLVVHFDGKKSPSPKCSFQKLRSLFIFDIRDQETQREENGNFLPRNIMVENKFICLKVLDLEGTYKPTLTKALGKLIHLRYLGLRRTWLDKLPSSVADLFNLQTLDLKCTNIGVIPERIQRMRYLRHLYLNGKVCCDSMSFFWLLNLSTLYGSFFTKKNPLGYPYIQERHMRIRKLGVTVNISSSEVESKLFICFKQLEHLKLKATDEDVKLVFPVQERSLGLNKLHLEGNVRIFPISAALLSGLTKLTMKGNLENSDPMTELGGLVNLRILRLWCNSYVGSKMCCNSDCFPKLEILEVFWLEKLESWQIKEGAMPNLRELEIGTCNKLTELPHGLRFLTNLKELRLPGLSNFARSRLLPYIGVDWYKIQHIPFISPPLCNDAAPPTASTSASTSSSTRTRRPTL